MSAVRTLDGPPIGRSRGIRWTPEEVATMRALYRDRTAFDIGRAIGRSPEAVRQKAIVLGLSQPTAARIRWSAAAIALLRAGYARRPTVELVRDLGTTVAAVCKQAQTLGLSRTIAHLPWTPEKDAILCEVYGLLPSEEIAARLGYSRSAVYNRLRSLG